MRAGSTSITLCRKWSLNGGAVGWSVYVDGIPQADLRNGEEREIVREQAFTVQVESPVRSGAIALTAASGTHDKVQIAAGMFGLKATPI